MINMGNWGHYSMGEQILAEYNISAHGDSSATYESMSNADLPSYAHGFYSPTEHENFSELAYQRTEINYDKNLKEIQEAINGPPLEAYIPRHIQQDDGSSSSPAKKVIEPIVIKDPEKEIINEILKAQQSVRLNLEETEVEEIIIKRRLRKRKLTIESRKQIDQG